MIAFTNHPLETSQVPLQVASLQANDHSFVRALVLQIPTLRDLEEMMKEHGRSVDHTTVWRWVQRYAPEINKRMRPHLKMSGTSYRVDETLYVFR